MMATSSASPPPLPVLKRQASNTSSMSSNHRRPSLARPLSSSSSSSSSALKIQQHHHHQHQQQQQSRRRRCDRKRSMMASITSSTAPEILMTPRTRYTYSKQRLLTAKVRLLMELDAHVLELIRTELAKSTAVDLYDFITLVCTQIQRSRGIQLTEQHIEPLREIFEEIDVNGDHTMNWEEFTSYLVDLANSYFESLGGQSAQFEHLTYLTDTAYHDGQSIQACKYIGELDKLVLVEGSSSRIKLFTPDMQFAHALCGHRADVFCVEMIAEHQLLASCSADRTIRFWSTASKQAHYLDLHMEWCLPRAQICLCWSGHCLLSGDTSGVITMWSLERNDKLRTLTGHTDAVMAMVSASGGRVVSASLDGTLRVWDLNTNTSIIMTEGHELGVHCVVYVDVYDCIVSGGLDNSAFFWSPASSGPVASAPMSSDSAHVIGICAIEHTPMVVIGDNLGCLYVYDVRTFTCIQSFSVPKTSASRQLCITYAAKHARLFSGGNELHAFRRVSTSDKTKAHDSSIVQAIYNSESHTFITASECTLRVWNALTGRLEHDYPGITGERVITAMCLDPRERRVFVGDHGGGVMIINYATGAVMHRLDSHNGEVSCMEYCPETQSVLTGSWDQCVRSHTDLGVRQSDHAHSSVNRQVTDHEGDVLGLAYSAERHMLVTSGADCVLCFYPLHTHLSPLDFRLHLPAACTSLKWLGDMPLLLAATDDGGVSVVYTLAKGQILLTARNEPCDGEEAVAVNGIDVDMDNQQMWTVDGAGYLVCWSLAPIMEAYQRIVASNGRAAAMSSTITMTNAAACRDRRYSVVTHLQRSCAQSMTPLRRFRVHDSACNGLQLLPHDGVLTWGDDRTVRITNRATGEQLGSLRQGYTRLENYKLGEWLWQVDVEALEEQEYATLEAIKHEVSRRMAAEMRAAAAEEEDDGAGAGVRRDEEASKVAGKNCDTSKRQRQQQHELLELQRRMLQMEIERQKLVHQQQQQGGVSGNNNTDEGGDRSPTMTCMTRAERREIRLRQQRQQLHER